MRMPLRSLIRPVVCGWLGLAVMGLFAAPSRAAAPAEKALPGSTVLFLKVNNAAAFREAVRQSELGQLWADPAMKPLRDDTAGKLDDASNKLKGTVGVSLDELFQLPEGPVSLALVGKEGGKVPVALLLSADAGKNAQKMADVLTKASKIDEDKGDAKVTTESFKDLTLHIVRSTKDEDKDDPPMIWVKQGNMIHIASDLDAVKDLVAHADGRDDSLAESESFSQVRKKVGEDAQALWFIDVGQGIKLFTKSLNANGGGNAQQIEAMLQLTGINGLKAMGGSLAFNVGNYDSQSKTFILAPGPSQGIMKIFSMPAAHQRPEPWVPAAAASYETISWDLDSAYTAINDLANMFQPGLLNALEQQIAGPNGGQFSFQKDVFGPLGDRITIISDFKKKVSNKGDDNQRTLFAVALEDTKAFQNSMNKIIELAKASPKKREFQGTTIYDFDVPDVPNAGAAGNVEFKGPISVAVAKETCFISTEPTLLEQVLRSGGPRLADSPEFQAIAKELPEQTSTVSFARPEESMRQLYDMLKGGQLQKALEQAMANNPNADVPKLSELIDVNKLPEFSVIGKYFSQSGGYGLMGDDGFYATSFTLRKTNP